MIEDSREAAIEPNAQPRVGIEKDVHVRSRQTLLNWLGRSCCKGFFNGGRTPLSVKPFQDNYGGHADDYARYRPAYPWSVLEQLIEKAPHRRLAWDCGTGNGQVACHLADHFDQVWASDGSELQLSHARPHSKVTYYCSSAEQSGLQEASVALVTVATAVHWFHLEAFYQEAHRVLCPGGVIGVWTYAPDLVAPEPLGEVVHQLANQLHHDWPSGMEWVDKRYSDLPFPFEEFELEVPSFTVPWALDDLLGWVSTWSGIHRYRKRTGQEPLAGLRQRLLDRWPNKEGTTADLTLPFYYRWGRRPASAAS